MSKVHTLTELSDKQDKNSGTIIDKAQQILQVVIEENDNLRLENHGLNYVATEMKTKLDTLNKENENLKNRYKSYTEKVSYTNKSFDEIFKSYGKELSEDKKLDIRNKYAKQFLN